MADKPGKYAAALAAINEPAEQASTVLLPVKAPIPSGKRSTPGEAESGASGGREHGSGHHAAEAAWRQDRFF